MFSETELEAIEDIVTKFGEEWIETRVDRLVVDSILSKCEAELNT